MTIQNQSLVKNIILTEKEIVQKAKTFLAEITKTATPLGIKLSDKEGNATYAVAYEQDHFVIVLPEGKSTAARVYGNWNEALFIIQQLANQKNANTNNLQLVLSSYLHNEV